MLGERPADRLDPAEAVPVLVDERYERVCGRSSSAATKLAAASRIPLPRSSSAISIFIALSRADSSVVVPGRVPASISCCLSQFRSVSREPMPSLSGHCLQSGRPVRAIAAHLGDHAHRTTAELKRVTGRPCHDSILS
ncbi:hypothetical protein [Streptomyces sp. NPDC002164]|uniref:hypothetical protein n=1 Tax=Streptomyces sp. NPDC002164 TaxID=3364633 RepID=UPI00367B437D